jgi:TolA-binding protein
MVKVNATGRKSGSSDPKVTATQNIGTTPVPAPTPAPNRSNTKKNKGNQSSIGGTAVQGARSTAPKQFTANANAQQQQMESYNREMRRRMERLNGDDNDRATSVQKSRQKRQERLKERRQTQLARVKRSLPGGKVDTSINRVYILLAIILVVIVLLIGGYLIFRGGL